MSQPLALHPDRALPADPLPLYAAALRLLAEQCAALAERVEQDGYPYYPEAALQEVRWSLNEALVHLASGR